MKHRQAPVSNNKLIRQVAAFTLFTFVTALAGYFAIMGLFRVFSFSISGAEDWSLLDGFVSTLSLSVIIGGLTYAVLDRIRADVTEAREKTKLSYDIYRSIFEKFTNPEQEAARRWILENVPVKKEEEDVAAWYERTHAKIMAREPERGDDLPQGQRFLKLTLNMLDYIGFIAGHYWEIEEDSLDWISPPVAKIWRRIGPYVAHVRSLRGAQDYYVFAERIGRMCIQWRRSRGLPDEDYAPNTP